MAAPFNFDRIADVYEETRRLPPIVRDGVAEQIASVFERGRVLDAGTGTGRWAEALQDRGLAVVGLDVSGRMLTQARARGLRTVVRGELTHLPFRDAAFDHAIAIHVLHLLPDWRAFLDELIRVTRTFLVSTRETQEPREIHPSYDEKVGRPERPKRGIDPEELADRVPPAFHLPKVTFVERQKAEQYLDLLEKKTFSHQWDVPDDIHVRAMRELREALAGKEWTLKRTWEVLVWRVEDLRAL